MVLQTRLGGEYVLQMCVQTDNMSQSYEKKIDRKTHTLEVLRILTYWYLVVKSGEYVLS